MTTATAQKAWTTTAGPLQTKNTKKALDAFRWKAMGRRRLSGVRGRSERVDILTPIFTGSPAPGYAPALEEIGERYGWTITAANYRGIIEDVTAATAALELPTDDERIDPAEDDQLRREQKERDERYARERAAADAALEAIWAKKPPGAVALIVAELHQDESDSMTDYFAHKTTRRVAIGWRTGTREDFRQLRRAAAGFPETAHLGPGCDLWTPRVVVAEEFTHNGQQYYAGSPSHWHSELDGGPFDRTTFATEQQARDFIAGREPEPLEFDGTPRAFRWQIDRESVEHRDNYYMGAGNYLKAHGGHRDGWAVRSRERGSCAGYTIEDAIPAAAPAVDQDAGPLASGAGYTIEQHTHTKKGTTFFLVILAGRVDRDTFERLRQSAKQSGGWYSRQWGSTPGGFAFGTATQAATWAKEELGTPTPSGPTTPGGPGDDAPTPPTDAPTTSSSAPTSGQAARAARLRALADGLQTQIDAGRRDRLENTPKRQKQAATARFEASNLEHAQAAMRALADAIDAGTVPDVLRTIPATKAAICPLMRKKRDHSREGYYGVCPTDEWYHDIPEARALQALVETRGTGATAAELAFRNRWADCLTAGIEGFHPTPPDIAAELVALAGIVEGTRTLEPSAGRGDLANAARDAGGIVDCIEKHYTLADMLRHQGHTVTAGDFLDQQPTADYAAVVMNPPFERGQDGEHVRHAWEFLAPGGTLAALVSPTLIQTQRGAAWRAWFEDHGGEIVRDIPAGSFANAGAGAVLILMRR